MAFLSLLVITMRQRLIFILDMTAVFLSPFAALFIRDGFVLSGAKVEKLIPLAIIATACAVPVFIAMGTHKIVWRYISLPDLIRTVGAATLAILLALPICFAVDRLQVARSIPLMQWLCLAAMLIGMRVLARAADRWRNQRNSAPPPADDVPLGQTEWTLIAGINPLADLYIQAVTQSANSPVRIAGLISADVRFKGRNLFQHKVLGGMDHLGDVLQELDVHGIVVTRIVLAEPLSQFTAQARHELIRAERERAIAVASIAELLGLEPVGSGPAGTPHAGIMWNEIATSAPLSPRQERYQRIKRLIDAGGAAAAIVLVAPIAAIICFIVIIDVGRPVIFWQQRPGKGGRPFKLYKFRTMRSAHDEEGMRIPDADRVTRTGALLRRLRLDELPQLFNVLSGDMSFVGPRPLLWSDMPFDPRSRLSIRPGITGWAQVNGGRVISSEDKAALDSWYVQHVSPSLDLKILRRTLRLLASGDVINGKALRAAYSASHPRPDTASDHSMGPIQPST